MLIVLSFILLTQIIYIPLQSIRYGKITVPIVLNYDPSGEEYGCPVAPGWTLSNSRGTPSEPFGQTVNGDGTHFRYGEKGELLQIEDDAGNQGFFRGIHYLRRESAFGAKLDFAANSKYAIYPRILYVTAAGPVGTIAQDNHNYGNFLWGSAAREVGIPQWLARLGAHINNFFISVYTRGTFDSPDDQLSIKAGYHWDNR